MLREILTILKLPFRKDRELYRSIHSMLGFWPCDIRLYQEALQHKSVVRKNSNGKRVNNERLEYLGDAILGAIVAEVVFLHFPSKPEGFLTTTRSKIVQRASLNRIAMEMGLDRLLSSQNARLTPNSNLLGNAFEALVGAIYLDRGYVYCQRFIEKQILKSLVDLDEVAQHEVNFKSKILEWGQKRHLQVEFLVTECPKEVDNGSVFITHLKIEGVECGEGRGYSKKESQQRAAKDALFQLRKHHQLEESVLAAKEARDNDNPNPNVNDNPNGYENETLLYENETPPCSPP